MTEKQIRQHVVDTAVAWLGKKESDGSHRVIIDTYNGDKPLPQGYTVTYKDAWCAPFVTAVAIKAGVTKIIPKECSCGRMIALFQKIDRWIENDAYVPSPGDVIFYDWNDGKNYATTDCTGWPEHVGLVVSVSGSDIKVIEGNKSDAVGYRAMKVNGRYIRGYGVPDYASMATEEPSGSGNSGSSTSTDSGSKSGLSLSPKWIGKVTASKLNVRKWAGTEYATLKSCPSISQNKEVEVCDTVKDSNGDPWYYIRIDGKTYGFVSAKHIQAASSSGSSGKASHKAGDIVQFTGTKHYTSSFASATGKPCKPGKAKVTAVNESGAHPYHLKNVSGGGSTVHGWVNSADIK